MGFVMALVFVVILIVFIVMKPFIDRRRRLEAGSDCEADSHEDQHPASDDETAEQKKQNAG